MRDRPWAWIKHYWYEKRAKKARKRWIRLAALAEFWKARAFGEAEK
jgi:hypothetical protein